MSFLSRFGLAKCKKEIRRPDLGVRIPKQLHEVAQKGVYRRLNPYPLAAIKSEFFGCKFVTRQTKIVTMGSCFAQELKKWLEKNDFTCLPHEWGVIYSPRSIRQIVQYSFDIDSWKPSEKYWILNNKFHDPFIKASDHSGPRYLGETEYEANLTLSSHYEKSSKLLREAGLVVWTLGLTELWQNRKDRLAFFAVPYPQCYDEQLHEFYNLTYQDVVDDLRYSIETLRRYNPSARILLSVSPVPLSISFRPELGPYVATQYSKSLLVTAAMSIINEFDHVYYMPSYEVTRNDTHANYSPDGRHVTSECVESIMELFRELYVC